MRFRTPLILGILSILTLASSRATVQEREATAPPRPRLVQVLEPSLLVRNAQGRLEPVRLESLKASAEVVGNLATTTLEMVFFNPQSRVLEGELVFPLGDGQRVSRFALEVDGRLREAVVVDKAKGRQVFEDIVRRGVDPGLLEQVDGNNYRARIYPIPAQGRKRILVGYEQELKATAKGLLYTLPLPSKEAIGHLELDIQVLKQDLEPLITSGSLAEFHFEKWEENFRARAELKDVKAREALNIEIPKSPHATPVHYSRERGRTYFYAWVEPLITAPPVMSPKRIALYWDISASSQKRRFDREWALLEALLKQWPEALLEVVTFSSALHERRSFPSVATQSADLKRFLEAQVPDGGTQLGSLDLDTVEADEILLSTDGLSNFGDGRLRRSKVPVQVIVSSLGADYSALHALADETGGQVLDLTRLETTEALKTLEHRPFQLLGIDVVDGQVKELYPRGQTTLQKGLGIAGILEGSATINLRFGYGDTVTATLPLKLEGGDTLPSRPAVRRLWAQKKLAHLDADHISNRDAIARISVEHGVVSRETSLIVLETLQDYLRYEIVPPREMRVEYDRLMQTSAQQKKDARKQHLEQVVQDYRQRIAWWERDFHPELLKDKKHLPPMDSAPEVPRQDLSLAYAGASVSGSAAPPSPAAPIARLARQDSMELSEEAPPPPPPPPGSSRARLAKTSGGSDAARPGSTPLPEAKIELATWIPQAPYLKRLQGLKNEELYGAYLELKAEFASSPGFFLDVADLFRRRGLKVEALRILSNIAELDLENAAMMRILGYRLTQLKQHELARCAFERVLAMREEEPQSHRDLALVLADLGQRQKAVDLLWKVISTPWNGRFPEIEALACEELNAIAARSSRKLKLDAIDPRLLKHLPVDLRVVMTWDTDNCDLDLHVTDPRGEVCFYSNPLTQAGGRISADFTQGYGPEEFLMKKALPGTYKVQAHYFSDRSQKAAAPSTLMVTFFTRFGTAQEKRQTTILRLTDAKEIVDAGSFTFMAE